MPVVDDEERRILERIARALRTGTASNGREGAEVEVAAPIRGSDPGFYEYVPERNVWRLVSRDKWRPAEDGLYAIFHDSYKCSLCGYAGAEWFRLARAMRGSLRALVEIGGDERAPVHPHVTVECISGGSSAYVKRYNGPITLPELATVVIALSSSCPSAHPEDVEYVRSVCPCAGL